MPCNTEGRFQLDKPAPATVRRRRVVGWGTARKAGASGEPGTAGEGSGVAQAGLAGAVGGLGSLEKVRPRLAWHGCLE